MSKFNRFLRIKLLERKIVQEILQDSVFENRKFLSRISSLRKLWLQVHNRMSECYRNWWESCFQNLEKLKAWL